MSQTFTLVAIIGFSLAAVLAIIAVILFFVLNIKQVRNDLTGKTATRSIAEIRARAKTRKRASSEAGKKLGWDATGPVKMPSGPLKSYAADASTDDVLDDEPATTHLVDDSDEEVTTMLSRDESGEEETTVLSSSDTGEETTVRSEEDDDEGQTTVLSGKKKSKVASGATLLIAGLLALTFGPGAVIAEGAGIIGKSKPAHAVATKAMVKYAMGQTGINETSSEGESTSTEGETTSSEGAPSTDGTVPTDGATPSDGTEPAGEAAATGENASASTMSGNTLTPLAPLPGADIANLEFGAISITPNWPVQDGVLYAGNTVTIDVEVYVPQQSPPPADNVLQISVAEGNTPLDQSKISYTRGTNRLPGTISIQFDATSDNEPPHQLSNITITVQDTDTNSLITSPLYDPNNPNDPFNPTVPTNNPIITCNILGRNIYTPGQPASDVIKEFSISTSTPGASISYSSNSPNNGYYFNDNVDISFNITDALFKNRIQSSIWANRPAIKITNKTTGSVKDFTYSEFVRSTPNPNEQKCVLANDPYQIIEEGFYEVEFIHSSTSAFNQASPDFEYFWIDKAEPIINEATVSTGDPVVWNWIPSESATSLSFDVTDELSCIDLSKTEVYLDGVLITDPNVISTTYTVNPAVPGVPGDSGKFTLTFPGPNQRIFFDNINIIFYDMAGNASAPINPSDPVILRALLNSQNQVVEDTTLGFLIDGEAPLIELAYSGGAAQNDYYFNAPRVATFTVTEETFDLIQLNDNSRSIVTIYRDESSSSITAEDFLPVGDGRTWTATYTFDADGEYRIEGSLTDITDKVSNSISDSFVIDQTEPFISLSFNNNDAGSGRYYNNARTATVTIRETNFSESLASTLISALDDAGTAVTAPAISGWTETEEDTWEATVAFTNELHYALKVGASDLAGNVGEEVEEQEFVIDTTNPIVRIEQVTTNTAYANVIAPKVYFEDLNFEDYRAKVSITAHSKVGDENNEEGRVHLESSEVKTDTSRTDTYADIPYEITYDDVYTMVAEIEDKAGNTAKETVVFSVNRFGSNYEFTTKTKAIVGTYMPEAQEIIVIETNVCGLESSWAKLSRNNEISGLTTGEDYTTNVLGDQSGWSRYEYVFPAELFADDGYYRVLLSSEDNAGNLSENLMIGKNSTRDDAFEVSFAIDGTDPVGSLGNITEGETVFSPAHNVDVFAGDNMEMSMVTLFVNGEEKQTWSAEEFVELGMQGYELPASDLFNTVSLEIIDRAGNVTTVNTSNVLITNDLYKYIMNTPAILYPAVAALSVLVALAVLLTIRLIRKGLARRRAKANRIEFALEA